MAQKFQDATELAKQLADVTTDEEKLNLYGLYKQANFGDNTESAPGMFSMDFKKKAKHQAYDAQKGFINQQKGKSQDQAKQEYVELVVSLAKKYQLDSIVEKLQ